MKKKVKNPLEKWVKEMNGQLRRKTTMTNEHLKTIYLKYFLKLSVKSENHYLKCGIEKLVL